MLDGYVYKTLKKYGNCVIGMQDLKKYGKKKILKDLSEHGFNCTIRVIGKDIKTTGYSKFLGIFSEANVIVEVKK